MTPTLEVIIFGTTDEEVEPSEKWPAYKHEAQITVLLRHSEYEVIKVARLTVERIIEAACQALEDGVPPALIALASIKGVGTEADPLRPA